MRSATTAHPAERCQTFWAKALDWESNENVDGFTALKHSGRSRSDHDHQTKGKGVYGWQNSLLAFFEKPFTADYYINFTSVTRKLVRITWTHIPPQKITSSKAANLFGLLWIQIDLFFNKNKSWSEIHPSPPGTKASKVPNAETKEPYQHLSP